MKESRYAIYERRFKKRYSMTRHELLTADYDFLTEGPPDPATVQRLRGEPPPEYESVEVGTAVAWLFGPKACEEPEEYADRRERPSPSSASKEA